MKTVNMRNEGKRRPGRPSIPPSEKRTTQVSFYVTPDEKKKLEAKAEKDGLSLSAWVVKRLLEG